MSIERSDYSLTIICDKCGTTQTADKFTYNDEFFESGWGLFPKARKYKHKCAACQTPAHRKANDFVKNKLYKPS